MRITEGTNWFEIWFQDKNSMLDIMLSNMISDLNNGYDWFGKSITDQRNMIENYKKKFDEQMDRFKEMEDNTVNRWCYYNLKKRGVIS